MNYAKIIIVYIVCIIENIILFKCLWVHEMKKDIIWKFGRIGAAIINLFFIIYTSELFGQIAIFQFPVFILCYAIYRAILNHYIFTINSKNLAVFYCTVNTVNYWITFLICLGR